jgi:hypothetical protein
VHCTRIAMPVLAPEARLWIQGLGASEIAPKVTQ